MSMITRCPACATTFRVTAQQLQAQQGLVRCGCCAHVFDGYEALAALADDQLSGARSSAQAEREDTVAAKADPDSPLPPAFAVDSWAPRTDADEEVVPSAAAARPAPPVAPKPRSRSVAYTVAALVLALIAQGFYFWRSEIAAYVPAAKPLLIALCTPLRCTVALPQRPAAISIEASDMQAVDRLRPGLTTLTATLHNRASIPLGYPALDVVLVNAQDHTVARRIFVPSEYVDDKDRFAGVPANAEAIVKLYIETGDLEAAGFRLALLAAPAGG